MLTPLDIAILTLIAIAQWRIGVLAVKWRPRLRRWAPVYYPLLAAGLLAGFSPIAARLALPPLPAAIIGAIAHAWSYACTAAWAIYAALWLFTQHIAPPPFDAERRRLFDVAAGALIASPFAAVGYGALVERSNFRVREVDVPIPGLAPDLEGLRLLQLSDIHLSAFLSEEELARVVDAANELRAHAALITGDLISSRGDPLDACLRQLARLRADSGIFGCLGNHEIYAAAERYATEQGARLGIRFLRQQAQALRFGNARLNLAGVDYQRLNMRREYLEGAERLLRPGTLNVLLSHNPDVFPVAARKGYNLTVSGHTHGGQVNVEILDYAINPARFFTPYTYGLYRSGPACAYVTRGIGTIGIPARIGAPPEITLLRLRRA